MRNNLRLILLREGTTQAEIARRATLSSGTVARISRNASNPSEVTIAKILKALNELAHREYKIAEVFPDVEDNIEIKELKQESTSKEQKNKTVEISISQSFSEFSIEEQKNLLDAISKLLNTSDVKIVRKRKGSVKLTVEVTSELASQLLEAANSGKLQELSVSSAKMVNSTKAMENLAFIIMKFGDEYLNSTYQLVIRQVLLDYGYTPLRIDEVQDSGRITDQILSSILSAKLVIADLSGERPNCYYEAGFAHALGKPMIFSIKDDEKVHFDLSGYRFIQWKTDMDLKKQLIKRLEAIKKNNA